MTIADQGLLRVAEITASTLRPAEGRSAKLTATLNHPAPAGGVEVSFTADGAGDNPAAPGADFTLAPTGPSPNVTARIAIDEGELTATGWLRVVNDDEPEDDEGIVVSVGASWAAPTPHPEIELTIPANDGGGGSGAAAWIEVEPNPVPEGEAVTVRVRLTRALGEALTIPLTVRRGTSEAGDHGTLEEIEIAAGETGGEGVIETTRDDDAEDETFTVRLGSPLPAGVTAGAISSVEVVIDDADELDVWIEAEPNPVAEGEAVTVTAVLTAPLARTVTIPVTVERGTSEQGDHGTLSGIRIAAGRIDGTGRITTSRDADGDDETFTVALGENMPAGVERGHPDEVEVTIADEGAGEVVEVTLDAEPNPVAEGERVTIKAKLVEALDRTVTIPVAVERVTSESGDHGSLSSIRIASGDTEGEGTITTSVDSDTDDEVFVVRLRANQPTGVRAGHPDSVDVTITDRGGDAPGRVRSLRAEAGDGRLELTWSAPSSGGAVSGYEAEYKKRSASEWQSVYETGGNYHDTKATADGLENGVLYDVRVRAGNEYGQGPWATASGTPTSGSSSNADLRSLGVTVSASENGTYAAASLSPSFRSSRTAYRTTAPAGTKWARFRPTSVGSDAWIIVHGHEVKSGAESPPVAVSHGDTVWISVSSADRHAFKEYSVAFSIPAASMDAGRTVTSATDAALAVVGTLSPEDAAGALLGTGSIEQMRLEALDRLGNANGRYDVGDFLGWIERCGNGAARCGTPPRTPPPASDAALPGTIGAAAKRPRRRPTGRRGPKRRRTGIFAVLFAAALWSCDGAGVLGPRVDAVVPDPGPLSVEWTAPAGGPVAAGALVEIHGPGIEEIRARGLALYGSDDGAGPWRFVVAGTLAGGPVIEFRVPDRNLAGLYSVRVVEVAGADHRLLEPDEYRAAVAR